MIVFLWPRRITKLSYLARNTVLVRRAVFSGFAQKIAHDGVAMAGLAALALACGLVVAGTQCGPGRQSRRRAEAVHIVADLDQDHGGCHLVDARGGVVA